MAKYEDLQSQADSLMQSGAAAVNQRRYDEAQQHFEAARKIYHSLHNRSSEGAAWTGLGFVAEKKREWTEAENCYQTSLTLISDDEASTTVTYLQLALLAERKCRLDEAEEWCERALLLAQQIDARGVLYVNVLNTFADVLLRQVRDEHAAKERLKEAQGYAEQSLARQEEEQSLARQQKRQSQYELWRILRIAADIAKLQGRVDEWRKYRRREREAYVAFPDRHPPFDPLWIGDPFFMPAVMNYCYFVAKGDPGWQEDVKAAGRDQADERNSLHISAVMRSMGRIARGERNWYRLCEAEDTGWPRGIDSAASVGDTGWYERTTSNSYAILNPACLMNNNRVDLPCSAASYKRVEGRVLMY